MPKESFIAVTFPTLYFTVEDGIVVETPGHMFNHLQFKTKDYLLSWLEKQNFSLSVEEGKQQTKTN